jgi:hypothetical protein
VKKADHPIWSQLRVVLAKWAREEVLTEAEQKVLIEAQNMDVNRYRTMRQDARDRPEVLDYGCW